jgi:transcription elongation factor Elf1
MATLKCPICDREFEFSREPEPHEIPICIRCWDEYVASGALALDQIEEEFDEEIDNSEG